MTHELSEEHDQELLSWFWSEYQNARVPGSTADGLCQCSTEALINASARPALMRAFLLVGVFIDQMMYTHCPEFYGSFRMRFRYPKLHSHSMRGMASPSWLVYSYHGFDQQINWQFVDEVADTLLNALFKWLSSIPEGMQATTRQNSQSDLFDHKSSIPDGMQAAARFIGVMEHDIRVEFEPHTGDRFLAACTAVLMRAGWTPQ